MTLEDRIRNHMNSVGDVDGTDVSVIAAAGARRNRRNRVATGVAVGAIALAGVFGVAQLVQQPTKLEVATGPTTTEGPVAATSNATQPSTTRDSVGEGGDVLLDPGNQSVIGPVSASFGGPTSVVVVGDQLAELAVDFENGELSARLSTDGVEWVDQEIVGLDSDNEIAQVQLGHDGDEYIAAIMYFEGDPGSDISGSTVVLARSADFGTWDVEPLDLPDEDVATMLSAFDVRDGRAIVVIERFPIEDEFDLTAAVADAGVLTEDELNSQCYQDLDSESGDIVVYSCDFDSGAETELARIPPDNPAHAALADFFEINNNEALVFSGATSGELVSAPIETDGGFIVGAQVANDAFYVMGQNQLPLIQRSEDGIDWVVVDAPDRLSDDFGSFETTVDGELLVASIRAGQVDVSNVETGELLQQFEVGDGQTPGAVRLIAGDATLALEISSFSAGLGFDDDVTVSIDGVDVTFRADGVLEVQQDGVVISTIEDWVSIPETVDGDALFEVDGDTLSLLDPITGAVIVELTEDDLDVAFAELGIEEPPILAPETTLYVSNDNGRSWQDIELPAGTESAIVSLLAVTDEAAIVDIIDLETGEEFIPSATMRARLPIG